MLDSFLSNRYDSYKSLVESVGEDVVRDRFNDLYDRMVKFLKSQKIIDKTRISDTILGHVLLNYFDDIARLKDYHQIKLASDVKIHAYTASWIARCKPI